MARGRSNPDVATELFLSRNTVQTHVSHILAKLGARSRAEIISEVLHHPARQPASALSIAAGSSSAGSSCQSSAPGVQTAFLAWAGGGFSRKSAACIAVS